MSESQFEYELSLLSEAYERGLKAFVTFAQNEWKFPTKEQWERNNAEPWPGADYQTGWDAALECLDTCLELFMDEVYQP